ncbi:MAG: hypothetical protein M2R45_05069 [Verrucomicrobia subdivision 3 bacterium]|nr:hypothetical protein [Limisphaerales bacterium]MCS1417734.1 hypothetical protein [Limisphaerales bacterium]
MRLPGRNQLTASTKDLLRQWELTRQVWRDQKADEFERKYLKELESSVNRAVHVMEKLDLIVTKVRKGCE